MKHFIPMNNSLLNDFSLIHDQDPEAHSFSQQSGANE